MAFKKTLKDKWKNVKKAVTLNNAYETRWVWYHTILAIELLIVILIQSAILIILVVKL